MSSWTELYNLASSWIKRPAVWLGGILTAAHCDFCHDKFIDPCANIPFRKNGSTGNSQLVTNQNSLTHDPDRSHTERVMRAFLGEKAVLVVPICESLNFDLLKDSQSAGKEAVQRAWDLIKAKHADLLLFGYVSEPDKAVLIYAVNEHGGCVFQPKPTEIKQGVRGSDFTAEEKANLIIVSLQEIQSACLNQSSIDWPLLRWKCT
jgi:hypothetical protein